MRKNYKDVFTAEELDYLEERRKKALEKTRRLPKPTEHEAAAIQAAAVSDPDAQPLTQEQLAQMRPAYMVHPELVASLMRRKRGRPSASAPKKQVTLRLDQDVIDHFKAGGPGWQTRINDALKGVAQKAGASR